MGFNLPKQEGMGGLMGPPPPRMGNGASAMGPPPPKLPQNAAGIGQPYSLRTLLHPTIDLLSVLSCRVDAYPCLSAEPTVCSTLSQQTD